MKINPFIIFVTATTSSNKTAEENLGLGYLSAICQENGIDTIIIDGWLENLTSQEIVNRIIHQRKPIFIGFSCNQLNGESAIEIVKLLKIKNYVVPFVAGGFAPTFNPEKFLKNGFDFVSIAEGESTILNLSNYYLYGAPDLKEINGLCFYDEENNFCYKKPTIISNLNKLPFPNRDTISFVIEQNTPVNMVTSRGCMSNCLFCSINAFWKLGHGPKWRGRDVKNIVDELEYLYNKGARHFKFVDDSFIEPPRDEAWCNALADEISGRNLDVRLRITMRADRVTEGIVLALNRAGCNLYACGIENFSDSALKRMGKRANSSQNKRALDIFKKHNVYVQMGFILFDYETTFSELKENYEMMCQYSWTICRGIFSEMYAAKGTIYTQLMLNKGLTGNLHLENYEYRIRDEKAQLVYQALKHWHFSHMKMYNMIIEPINKPKVISDEGLSSFYCLYLDVRRQDLLFMGKVLNFVENGAELSDIEDFVLKSIKESNQWFNSCKKHLEKMYETEKIKYLAEDDPFITL